MYRNSYAILIITRMYREAYNENKNHWNNCIFFEIINSLEDTMVSIIGEFLLHFPFSINIIVQISIKSKCIVHIMLQIYKGNAYGMGLRTDIVYIIIIKTHNSYSWKSSQI